MTDLNATNSKSNEDQQQDDDNHSLATAAELELFSCDLPVQKKKNTKEREEEGKKKEGILYKQREVFKSQWRPRWFVLDEEVGTLSYYLFSSKESIKKKTIKKSSSTTTASAVVPKERRDNDDEHVNNEDDEEEEEDNDNTNKAIAVNYDVMPRGSINLKKNSCQVEMNDELSRPEEDIFVFIIIPNQQGEKEDTFCLATTTASSRHEWVEAILRVSGENNEVDKTTTICIKKNNKRRPQVLEDRKKINDSCMATETRTSSQEQGQQENVDNEMTITKMDDVVENSLPLYLLSLVLMTPLILYKLINIIDSKNNTTTTNGSILLFQKEDIFLLSAFLAIRTVTLFKLGIPIHPDNTSTIINGLTYRIYIPIKKLKKSKDNCKKDGKKKDDNEIMILFSQIIQAVGTALKDFDGLRSQKVIIPYLGIHGYFLSPGRGKSSDLSVLLSTTDDHNANVTTISAVEKLSSEEIVNKLVQDKEEEKNDLFYQKFSVPSQEKRGSCLVVMMNSEEEEVRISPGLFNVIVTVEQHPYHTPSKNNGKSIFGANNGKRSSKTTILRVEINCPTCTNKDCKQFVQRIQEELE